MEWEILKWRIFLKNSCFVYLWQHAKLDYKKKMKIYNPPLYYDKYHIIVKNLVSKSEENAVLV